MLFYVITSDNGAREDASVYYARYLIVGADRTDKPKVDAAIKKVLGGVSDLEKVKLSGGSIAEDLLGRIDLTAFIDALKAEGYQSQLVYPDEFIVTTY